MKNKFERMSNVVIVVQDSLERLKAELMRDKKKGLPKEGLLKKGTEIRRDMREV